MALTILKKVLPNQPVPTRILRGPFRGARIVMNPRTSLRKVFGLYEHELNSWLTKALKRVTRVLDVGANDGYFTFGCAAALRRLRKNGEIIAFEPQPAHVEQLRSSIGAQAQSGVHIEIVHAFVGKDCSNGTTTLDSLRVDDRTDTLIKIDVEGAEIDVIMGARSWLHTSNLFLIEIHKEVYLTRLSALFAEKGLRLVQLNQRPLRFFGGEVRDKDNWWLVSELRAEV
jgi:hypothetical protein